LARTALSLPPTARRLSSGRVPRAAIRRYVRQVVERFHPERVILFGSHAYGRPHADSDVDLLVVMPARNMVDTAVRIRSTFDTPFPMDLLVRTAECLAKRLALGDQFMRQIVEQGIVLHDAAHAPMVAQGRLD
jgi:predicted nucleotidyltransferase